MHTLFLERLPVTYFQLVVVVLDVPIVNLINYDVPKGVRLPKLTKSFRKFCPLVRLANLSFHMYVAQKLGLGEPRNFSIKDYRNT